MVTHNKDGPEVNNEITSVKKAYRVEIIWINVIVIAALHIGALYGFYLFLMAKNIWATLAWGKFNI